MENNIAYILNYKHFYPNEIDLNLLKGYTDNAILEYGYNNSTLYFKRALFELDRLNFNIGILLKDNSDIEYTSIIKDLLENLKGFNINIGIWLEIHNIEKLNIVYKILNKLSDHYIIGIRGDYEQSQLPIINQSPIWTDNGDIEDNYSLLLNFTQHFMYIVKLNTDYITIHKENNLQPIKSNENIDLLL